MENIINDNNRNYILNKETSKIELPISKVEYKALSEDLQKEIKGAYLCGRNGWVSRSTNNHYRAIKVAEMLGYTNGGSIGEKLSFKEEINRTKEKAEARIEKYEQYADNAEKRRESLQSEFNSLRGDLAFVTQPNINSAGGRSFTSYREKVMNRYKKGFEEYRKSEYFKDKARTAEETANMDKFKNKTYLDNRIKECNKNIKVIEERIVKCEDIIYKKENNIEIKNSFVNEKAIENYQEYLQETLEKMEYEMDKLAYLENCMDGIGGITYSKDNVKEGCLVKIRGTWYSVIKANKTTVEGEIIAGGASGMVLKHSYAEIQEVKIPEGFKESENEIKNPYVTGDILVHYACGSNRIIIAYQVIKITAKGVQLQKINLENNNKPMKDDFTIDKPIRKGIVKSKYSDFVGCYDGDWQLYKWEDK